MSNDPRNIMPGDRVRVFNSRVYKDDKSTPLSVTMQLATVLCRYGKKYIHHFNQVIDDYGYTIGEPDVWIYPDLVDVKFDNDERISHGHFTNQIEVV